MMLNFQEKVDSFQHNQGTEKIKLPVLKPKQITWIVLYALSPSGSKIVEMGMDPNNFFEMAVQVRDKKSWIIMNVKTMLNIDAKVDRIDDLLTSDCNVIKTDGKYCIPYKRSV